MSLCPRPESADISQPKPVVLEAADIIKFKKEARL